MSERESTELQAVAEGKCPACGASRPDVSAPCPHCHAPPVGPAEAAPAPGTRPPSAPVMSSGQRRVLDALTQVRASDIEPYIGLRYLSKLFRLMAILLLLLLIAEVVMGFISQGSTAIPTLLAESSRLIVAAGLLWGAGDVAILLIDIGHDLRATRILIGRQAAHHLAEEHQHRRDDARDAR